MRSISIDGLENDKVVMVRLWRPYMKMPFKLLLLIIMSSIMSFVYNPLNYWKCSIALLIMSFAVIKVVEWIFVELVFFSHMFIKNKHITICNGLGKKVISLDTENLIIGNDMNENLVSLHIKGSKDSKNDIAVLAYADDIKSLL